MQVKRLDLGVDVVHVPTRDVLVIHPDLDYAQALGAVMGTLPHLHPDVAVGLVDQVIPRPAPPVPVTTRLVRAVAGVLGTAVAAVVLGIEPATATAEFGEIWQRQAAAMGLECKAPPDGGLVTCLDDNVAVTVAGMRYRHADCYLIDRPGDADTEVLVFDHERYARAWEFRHPDAQRAGRVVIQ